MNGLAVLHLGNNLRQIAEQHITNKQTKFAILRGTRDNAKNDIFTTLELVNTLQDFIECIHTDNKVYTVEKRAGCAFRLQELFGDGADRDVIEIYGDCEGILKMFNYQGEGPKFV